MKSVLLIFVGGGLGSVLRYGLGKTVQQLLPFSFPGGTLAVNISASLLMGLFLGLELEKGLPSSWRLFVAVGICGGFSTFSTFANDTLILLQDQRILEALLNILLNVVLCILATFFGIWLLR